VASFDLSCKAPREHAPPGTGVRDGRRGGARNVDVGIGRILPRCLSARRLRASRLTDAEKRIRTCQAAHCRSLGVDVHARTSVEVGMESAAPGPGARTCSPRGCGGLRRCRCTRMLRDGEVRVWL
jgi:hypothetical protein